jgi:FKBP-type peptidyl-prolyl cis-trans isomerase
MSRVKKEHVHRFIWLFMAVLFIVTALGVGIYAFWVNTHNNPESSYISCPVKPVTAKQQKKNGKLQGAKLAGFEPMKNIDYVKCQDIKVGNGKTVTPTSTITAIYTGALAKDGTIFQSSEDTGQPFTASLSSGVIQGWTAGIPGMKAGGKRRIFIPSQYAYGAQGSADIAPYSDLVFDVTVLAVK